jgi:hypothetical protein
VFSHENLTIADHIPPSTSPWFVMAALKSSFLSLALMHSRCASSFDRYATFDRTLLFNQTLLFNWTLLFESISGFSLALFSFSSVFLICVSSSPLDWAQCFFAIFAMSSLKFFHKVWGFSMARGVWAMWRSVKSFLSCFPQLTILSVRVLFLISGTCIVHRPFPM